MAVTRTSGELSRLMGGLIREARNHADGNLTIVMRAGKWAVWLGRTPPASPPAFETLIEAVEAHNRGKNDANEVPQSKEP